MMQVFVATYTHKHGSDLYVFSTPEKAEAWRQELAVEYWENEFPPEAEKPADRAKMADAYFEKMAEYGDEFFDVQESEVQ